MSHDTYFGLDIFVDPLGSPASSSAAGEGSFFAVAAKYFHVIMPHQQTWLAYDRIVLPRGEHLALRPESLRVIFSGMGVNLPESVVRSFEPGMARFSGTVSDNPLVSAGRFFTVRMNVTALSFPSLDAAARAVRESEAEAEAAIRTVPASVASIEALEVVESEVEDRCGVCLEEFGGASDLHDDDDDDDDGDDSKSDEIVRLPCSHVYHRDCIVQWLKKSHLCPLCRYAMPTSS